jgi:hypothetical protein
MLWVSVCAASCYFQLPCAALVTRLRRILQFLPDTRQLDFRAAGLIKKNKLADVRQPLFYKFPELVYIRGVVRSGPSKWLHNFNGQARMLLRRQEHWVAQANRFLLAQTTVGLQPAEDHDSGARVQAIIKIRLVFQSIGKDQCGTSFVRLFELACDVARLDGFRVPGFVGSIAGRAFERRGMRHEEDHQDKPNRRAGYSKEVSF